MCANLIRDPNKIIIIITVGHHVGQRQSFEPSSHSLYLFWTTIHKLFSINVNIGIGGRYSSRSREWIEDDDSHTDGWTWVRP